MLDRCLVIWLPTISDHERRSEEELNQAFTTAYPRIFGALLDVVSGALRDLPNTRVNAIPRMADFALWVSAAEKSLGWPTGSFINTYRENQAIATAAALEASAIGIPLIEFLRDKNEWTGSATELWEELECQLPEKTVRRKGWPSTSTSMGMQLSRLAPVLNRLGWDVEVSRDSTERKWTIRRQTKSRLSPGKSVPNESVVQTDANQCEPSSDDTHNTNDTFSRNSEITSEQDGDAWEEGAL